MCVSDEFAYAKDSVSQVITLSSGVLALSLTFAHDWAGSVSRSDLQILKYSWFALLVAIVCGVWSMLVITGLVGIHAGSTNTMLLRVPWILELCAFAAGVALFTTFGYGVV